MEGIWWDDTTRINIKDFLESMPDQDRVWVKQRLMVFKPVLSPGTHILNFGKNKGRTIEDLFFDYENKGRRYLNTILNMTDEKYGGKWLENLYPQTYDLLKRYLNESQ